MYIVRAQTNVSFIYASISYNGQNLIAAVYVYAAPFNYWSVYSIVIINQDDVCLTI
jgi:hypothetical protein